ncbi:aminoglycoside adenylyltransferase domain-containing protein [Georgenia sp. Z1491]|uniref:aminoglycoside adenylyltransferase domain-containing protein n=1 Tax=Georgenia sp. Z1491 TaxID=3416707 RepID=UPI003CE920CC
MDDDLIRSVLGHLRSQDPGGVVGVYLCGSGATTGLYPDSDVDLLVLTRRSLTTAERAPLVSLLLDVSGWSGHEGEFPAVVDRRPLEVTSVVVDDVVPLTEQPRRDFQFGEWMRSELVDGVVPVPERDPDVVVLLSAALGAHRVLQGASLRDVVPRVPPALLRQAQLDLLPDVLDGLVGDERNVLLTLARMAVTAESGQLLPKRDAAERIRHRLDEAGAGLLALAREEYLGRVRVDWSRERHRTLGVVQTLRRLVHDAADDPVPGSASGST